VGLYLFTTMLHTGALGALLTLSPAVWYAPYNATALAWGLSPLEDQQLGGLIMWIPAGAVLRSRWPHPPGPMLRMPPSAATFRYTQR
jgi:cytochrome c oxidase assembly factor CtaG